MKWKVRNGLWSGLTVAAMACGGGEKPPRKDTTPSLPSPEVSVRLPSPSRWHWDAGVGDLFAVPGPNPGTARVVRPSWSEPQTLDSLTLDAWTTGSPSLDLLAGSIVVGAASFADVRVDSACVGWPVGTLVPPPQGAWRIAFEGGRVSSLALDSLPAVPAADSAAIITRIARAASRLSGDTAAAFRGRPFIVRQAIRFSLPGGPSATVAEVVRMVSQEANPLQEQIVLIIESREDGTDPVVGFHARSIGLEENLTSVEVVAALRVSASGKVGLVLRREGDAGFFLQWLERRGPGDWVLTWQSALDGC